MSSLGTRMTCCVIGTKLGSGGFTAWIFAGLVIYSAGLASLGVWLKTEEPVDQPDPIAIA